MSRVLTARSRPRHETPASHHFVCCVAGCRCLVTATGRGWALPVCGPHADQLPARLLERAEACAEQSPFNPEAVLEAALVITKIKARFALVAEGRKAKRKP